MDVFSHWKVLRLETLQVMVPVKNLRIVIKEQNRIIWLSKKRFTISIMLLIFLIIVLFVVVIISWQGALLTWKKRLNNATPMFYKRSYATIVWALIEWFNAKV